ncbi:MAG: peptide deformylase [Ruminococcus sp.]|nr:peptide deformylase [Ruminococcus sp.]
MFRELMHDPMFLGIKSKPATKEDSLIARDLLDTLTANREICVGMAANMIGKAVRIIVFIDGAKPSLMFNPEIISKAAPTKPRKAVCRFSAHRARVSREPIRATDAS